MPVCFLTILMRDRKGVGQEERRGGEYIWEGIYGEKLGEGKL